MGAPSAPVEDSFCKRFCPTSSSAEDAAEIHCEDVETPPEG